MGAAKFRPFCISIHAPREGSDSNQNFTLITAIFQSTLPVRGATNDYTQIITRVVISIHAPREGSDLIPCSFVGPVPDFNPRSP